MLARSDQLGEMGDNLFDAAENELEDAQNAYNELLKRRHRRMIFFRHVLMCPLPRNDIIRLLDLSAELTDGEQSLA